jgi:hypothetical protein
MKVARWTWVHKAGSLGGVMRRPPSEVAAAAGGSLRKGLSETEVEQMAGKPTSSVPNGQTVTKKYDWQDGVLEADFHSGILVDYRTSSM